MPALPDLHHAGTWLTLLLSRDFSLENEYASSQSMQGQTDKTHLDEKFASAKDEARVCVTNASGKLAEGARIAGVRVCTKKHFSCKGRLHMSIILHLACALLHHSNQSRLLSRCQQSHTMLICCYTISCFTEMLEHLSTWPHHALVLWLIAVCVHFLSIFMAVLSC